MTFASGLAAGGVGLVVALAAAESANAASTPVYPGCSTPPPAPSRSLHVVPGAAASGDGTAKAPMSLERALSAAKPGDFLYLAGGDYGLVTLVGENAGFVTVSAEPGQKPVLKGLRIGGYHPGAAGHWRVANLVITGARDSGLMPGGWQRHPPLVEIFNSNDVILDGDTIQTVAGDYKWAPEIQGQSSPEQLVSGVDSENSNCVAVTNNIISNVFNGIAAGGDQLSQRGVRLLLSGNEIHDFAGDGIDHFGSHVIISRNRIENNHNECQDRCIHNDGIQGWNYNGKPGVINVDVLISQNTIVDRVVPQLEQPPNDFHGITIFDGNWDGVRVENNVVVASTYHGITLGGVENAEIVNNTVLSPNPARSAWIAIGIKKGDPASPHYTAIVRNNIASSFNFGQGAKAVLGIVADHNLVTRNPRELFKEFDPRQGRYDMHLSKHSAAIGAGAKDKAPATDLEGRNRSDKIDAGALAADSF